MHRVRSAISVLSLALLTSVAAAWIAALSITEPNYTCYKRGTIVHWARAWEFSEFHGFARDELNWVDLNDQLPGLDPARFVAQRQAQMRTLATLGARLSGVTLDNTPPSWGIFADPDPPAPGIQGSTVVYGWPIPCLEYSLTNNLAPNQTSNHTLHDGVIIRGSPYQPYGLRALPLRPHPLGLLLNSAMYAVALTTLAQGIPYVRRELRRRRHLCPRCAYSRQGLAPDALCPECARPNQ